MHLPASARDRSSDPGPRSPSHHNYWAYLSQWSTTREATTGRVAALRNYFESPFAATKRALEGLSECRQVRTIPTSCPSISLGFYIKKGLQKYFANSKGQ